VVGFTSVPVLSEPAKAFLRAIPIFGGLEDKPLERLVEMLEERTFPAGTTVCKQGDMGRSMYIVRSGEVVLNRVGNTGTAVRVSRLGPGEFFGETTLLEIHARTSSVVVDSTQATLYVLSNASLYTLYREDTQAYVMVIQNISRELSRRLRRAEERICEMAEESGDDRTQIGQSESVRNVLALFNRNPSR
jgi:CRP/FNR family cyclic AMP-dependent transcriptional regulator